MIDYHDWEIWNGKPESAGYPDGIRPSDMVQVQRGWDSRAVLSEPTQAREYSWRGGGSMSDIIAFRRVKKPETVTITGYSTRFGWYFGVRPALADTHRLTFEIVNGEARNPRLEKL